MTEKRPDMRDGEQTTAGDEDFAREAGAQLRESAEQLDAATLSRLNQARQRALDEMPGGARTGSTWWVPAGVTAVAAAVVFGLWQAGGPDDPAAPVVPVTADDVADFELLLDAGDLEMLEDLEFFAWLATTDLEAAG